MAGTSNVVAKSGVEKVAEKVAEKRRALGRGLESLLPGPRVVKPASEPTRTDAASSAAEAPNSSPSQSSEPTAIDSSVASSGTQASIAAAATVNLEASAEALSPGGSVGGQATEVIRLEIARIDENPYQTRLTFDEKALMELAQSIRAQGVLQPIVVRPGEKGYYKLILGERRLRAARLAGMEAIPAIVKRVSEQQAAEMTVVENLQRQDLNCVDQAAAFANLSTQFKLTQEQIGARVGLSRETVANYMRLLTLSDGIIGALQKGTLTYSHARALLMVQDTAHRWTLAKRVMEEKMSVARLEALVQGIEFPRESKGAREGGARWVDPNVKAAQRSLEEVLGMRVRIRDRQGRGRILIDYSTLEDFDRVVKMLKGKVG
jgi:ParB family chromosome partitioning protein